MRSGLEQIRGILESLSGGQFCENMVLAWANSVRLAREMPDSSMPREVFEAEIIDWIDEEATKALKIVNKLLEACNA